LDVTSLVVGLLTGFLVIGVVAGWLAARRVHGGLGLTGSIGVGVLGAFAGGFLFPPTNQRGPKSTSPSGSPTVRGTGFATPPRVFGEAVGRVERSETHLSQTDLSQSHLSQHPTRFQSQQETRP